MEDDDPRSEGYKLAMNSPLDEPLKIYPVSDLVNSPKKDDAWGAKNGAGPRMRRAAMTTAPTSAQGMSALA